ncbi:MAG: hypothetical protein ACRENE_33335 [Polyangiaceae bacterium]
MPIAQSPELAQATHACVVALQWVAPPPMQFVSERHPTQNPAVVSQYGVGAPHMPSLLQGVAGDPPDASPPEDVLALPPDDEAPADPSIDELLPLSPFMPLDPPPEEAADPPSDDAPEASNAAPSGEPLEEEVAALLQPIPQAITTQTPRGARKAGIRLMPA